MSRPERRFVRLFPAAAIVAGLCVVAPTASASPQDLFGFGGRTPALAMTGTSYAEGVEAVFANPAGLGAARRRALQFGVQGGGYSLNIDGVNQPITPARGIVIGFQLPLPFEDILEDRLVFGGAFYTPAEFLLRGTVRFPEVPQWTVLDRGQVLGIMVGLGLDLHGVVDGLQIGGGFGALANVFGELDVRLDETNAFSSVVETQLLVSFAPFVGARYAQDEWGVGLAYRHQNAAFTDLNIRTADLPIELPVLRVGGLVQYDPPTLLAEVYWRPVPDIMLVVNLTTRFWGEFAGTQISTTAMGLNAPNPNFNTIPSPRAAIEGTWADENLTLQFRGGYAFEASPAPPANIAPRRTASGDDVPGDLVAFRLIDNHRHILTAGLGITIHLAPNGERLVLDSYVQAHILQDRVHRIGITNGAPGMRTGGYIIQAGWTLKAEF